ncbi:hypothetical protein HDU67_001876 [Dinochytrium kinnereticum]|nr:hypothetical protein HDU67_001876 [Dinochytrium kinnereticum]
MDLTLERACAILGIERTATQHEARSAYLKLAKKFHPDRNKDRGSSIRFHEIVEAFAHFSAHKSAHPIRNEHHLPKREEAGGSTSSDSTLNSLSGDSPGFDVPREEGDAHVNHSPSVKILERDFVWMMGSRSTHKAAPQRAPVLEPNGFQSNPEFPANKEGGGLVGNFENRISEQLGRLFQNTSKAKQDREVEAKDVSIEKRVGEQVDFVKAIVLGKLRRLDIKERFHRLFRIHEESAKSKARLTNVPSDQKHHDRIAEIFGDEFDESLLNDEVLLDIANNIVLADKP